MGLVIRQVPHAENAVDVNTVRLLNGRENGGDTGQNPAIIADALDALGDGLARGDGRHQKDHVLSRDHGLGVLAEHHLAVAVVLRRDHINGLVSIL